MYEESRVDDFIGGENAATRLTSNFILQFDDACVDLGFAAQGMIDPACTAEKVREPGQEFVLGMSDVGAVVGDGPLDSRSDSRPGLGGAIALLNEETEGGAFASRENCDGVRMIESGQIPEIAVLSKREFGVGGAHGHVRAHENRDGIRAHCFEELLTPF